MSIEHQKGDVWRPAVLFVGGFATSAPDGTLGGQVVACRQLVESPLGDRVRWVLLDSTQRSQPLPPLIVRAWDALWRIARYLRHLMFGRIERVLIFTSIEPASFLEKGLMALTARAMGKHVAVAIRSEVRGPEWDSWLTSYKRLVLQRIPVVICQSEMARSALVKDFGTPEDRTVVIPNWIDVAPYAAAQPRNARDLPFGFLYLGWLESFKGTSELIQAAIRLNQEGVQFELVVCGEGSQSAFLRSEVARHGLTGRVLFRGWVTDEAKRRALREAHALVLPSRTEGMPNAILEAMASGLPVVATRVGGVPELVIDGETGILVEARDVDALSLAMKRLAADPAVSAEMGLRGLRRAREVHDLGHLWREVAATLELDFD